MTTLNDDNKYIQQEMWSCEHCPQPPPVNHVTKIELPYAGLVGTLPTEMAMIRYLHRLDLRGNRIYGSLPSTLAQMEYLQYLDLTRNDLTGTIADIGAAAAPEDRQIEDEEEDSAHLVRSPFPKHIKEIWLGANQLQGTIPLELGTPDVMHLDLSKNQLTGSLPRYGRKQMPRLKSLYLEDNQLSGKLPPKWIGLTSLEVLDVGGNRLNGTIPTIYGSLSKLRDFNIVGNQISGIIPTELMKLSNLEALMLSENRLSGTIPAGDDTVPNRAMRDPSAGYKWSQLEKLQYFHASDNYLTSTIPPDIFYGVMPTILRCVSCDIC
jgi:Leucine-rich repeat (LRR) protein